MKKNVVTFSVLLLSFVLFCGCAQKERAAFDLGHFNGRQYQNQYLGLTFDAGDFIIHQTELDSQLSPIGSVSQGKPPVVLTTLSMGESTDISSYPLLQITAQHVGGVPYSDTAMEYVEQISELFRNLHDEYYEMEKDERKLNGRSFAAICSQIFTQDGNMFYLDLYGTVEGDYFVAFSALTLDPQQSKEVNNVLQTVKFSR